MRVTYIGATGTVRMVYLNVAMYNRKGEHLVELLSVERWQDTENGKAIIKDGLAPNFRCCDHYSTMALINLAPGEYLEWSKDAERS